MKVALAALVLAVSAIGALSAHTRNGDRFLGPARPGRSDAATRENDRLILAALVSSSPSSNDDLYTTPGNVTVEERGIRHERVATSVFRTRQHHDSQVANDQSAGQDLIVRAHEILWRLYCNANIAREEHQQRQQAVSVTDTAILPTLQAPFSQELPDDPTTSSSPSSARPSLKSVEGQGLPRDHVSSNISWASPFSSAQDAWTVSSSSSSPSSSSSCEQSLLYFNMYQKMGLPQKEGLREQQGFQTESWPFGCAAFASAFRKSSQSDSAEVRGKNKRESRGVNSSSSPYCPYSWFFLAMCVGMGDLLWFPCAWLFSCAVWCFQFARRSHFLPRDLKTPGQQYAAVVLIMLSLFPAPFASSLKVTAANWAELKTMCEAGGNEVSLSDSFDGSVYSGHIDFSGKTCMIKGRGQILDANEGGRFFYGMGAGSSLEVHGLVLKNGKFSAGHVRLSFHLHFFFLEKELTQLLVGHMELLGRSYLCSPWKCGDPQQHLSEQHLQNQSK
jgi:hypothetical protein